MFDVLDFLLNGEVLKISCRLPEASNSRRASRSYPALHSCRTLHDICIMTGTTWAAFMSFEKLRFADFELDRPACQLRRDGQLIHLERIPLEVLFLLAERRGQLVSRQEILDQVWGKDVFV